MAEIKTGIEGELYVFNGTISWTGTVATAGSRMAFVEGASYSWDIDGVPAWDRGTFSHHKKGRGKGELTIPQAYVANEAIIAYLEGTVSGSTAPRLQAEIRVFGTASSTLEHTLQFSDLFLKHYERNEPEGADKVTWSMGFDYYIEPTKGTGSRISG